MKKTEQKNEITIIQKDLSKPQKNLFLLIGIGIFSWEGIGSFAFLFEKILKDILLNIKVSPNIIEWSAALINFFIYIIGIIILAKVIIKKKISYLKIFIVSLLFLLIAQVLQFIEPIINNNLRTDLYLNNSIQYYDFLSEHPLYYSISPILGIVLWLLVAIIIYLKRNYN